MMRSLKSFRVIGGMTVLQFDAESGQAVPEMDSSVKAIGANQQLFCIIIKEYFFFHLTNMVLNDASAEA